MVQVSTFHSVGNAIIHKNSPEEKLNIARESQLYFTVRDYFRESIMKNERMVNKLILFFHHILMLRLKERILIPFLIILPSLTFQL